MQEKRMVKERKFKRAGAIRKARRSKKAKRCSSVEKESVESWESKLANAHKKYTETKGINQCNVIVVEK